MRTRSQLTSLSLVTPAVRLQSSEHLPHDVHACVPSSNLASSRHMLRPCSEALGLPSGGSLVMLPSYSSHCHVLQALVQPLTCRHVWVVKVALCAALHKLLKHTSRPGLFPFVTQLPQIACHLTVPAGAAADSRSNAWFVSRPGVCIQWHAQPDHPRQNTVMPG